MLVCLGVFVGSSAYFTLPEYAYQFQQFGGSVSWVQDLGEATFVFKGIFGLFIDNKPISNYR